MNKQKGFSTVLLIVILLVIGGGVYYFLNSNTSKKPEILLKDSKSDRVDNNVSDYKVYKDEKNKFEINYPSHLSIEGNPTVESGNIILANVGDDYNQSVSINVSNFQSNETLDQYYQKTKDDSEKRGLKNLQKIELQTSDMSQKVFAVRYEFDPVLKQQYGGYTYVLIENNKIFEFTLLSINANRDKILDEIMKTFKSIK